YTVEETAYDITGKSVTVKYSVNSSDLTEGKAADAAVIKNQTANVAFEDDYKNDTGSIKISKTVTGITEEHNPQIYSFEVKNSDDKWITTDGTVSDSQVFVYVTEGTQATIENLPIGLYSVTENKAGAARTNYILKVTGEGNVTVKKNDEAVAAITNVYTRKSGSTALKVTKNVTGNTYSGTEEFSFTLTDANEEGRTGYKMPTEGLTQNVKSGATATFGTITFDTVGKYYFKIKETAGDTTGMSYDTSDKYAEVTVSENADGKTLDASVKYGTSLNSCTSDTLTVTNTYSKTTFTPEVVKKVKGTDVPVETYTFSLTDKSNDKTGEILGSTTAEVTGQGTASFGEITYTKAGTYVYDIAENEGETAGMTYSGKKVTITVTVSAAADGALSVTNTVVTGGDTADHEIENSYEKPSGRINLTVKKAVNGTNAPDETFTFEVSEPEGQDTLPAVKTATAKDKGIATFAAINYDKADKYTYTITEKVPDPKTKGMSYSTQSITAHVNVKLDGGVLAAEVTYEGGDGTDKNTFTNTYTSVGVKINKVDITGEKEVAGAELVVKDSEGEEVANWVSAEKQVWTITGLRPGEEYTLEETTHPAGYDKITTAIKFTVDEDGKVTVKDDDTRSDVDVDENVVLVKDAPSKVSVTINKFDITGEEELEGAVLKVTDGDKYEKTWESKKNQTWTLTDLEWDKEYTLTETTEPKGYDKITTEIKFTVDKDGKVTVKNDASRTDVDVENNVVLVKDAPYKVGVKINKVDITGDEEIEGAELKVTDGDKYVKTWESKKDQTWTLSDLEWDKEYTLEETTQPKGYDKITTAIKFTVDKDGKVTVKNDSARTDVDVKDNVVLVKDTASKVGVKINKVDITGDEEIEGAVLKVTDGDKYTKTWISKENEVWTLSDLEWDKEYTLTETTQPKGYDKITTAIKFTVDKDGKVTVVDDAARTDVDVENNVVLVKDKPSKVSVVINKVDITGEEELEGAELKVTDGDKYEKTWESKKDQTWTLEDLEWDKEYTLEETTQPK
ncbi:MAG: hypothetical protein HUJ76_10315, partial [Parasporobacterium sp.]|nr:hypothetical protein [Parasporobacterium sp.]